MISTRLGKDANTIGLWHCMEGSGTTTKDYSGNGYNGTFHGSPSWASGPLGGEIHFPGTVSGGSYVDCGTCPNIGAIGTGDFSVELITKNLVANASDWVWLINKTTAAYGNGLYMCMLSGKFRCSLGPWFTECFDYTLGPVLVLSALNYLVLTRKAGYTYGYANGVQIASPVANTYNLSSVNSYNLRLGRHEDLSNPSLTGNIAELRISNIARSAAEIKHNWLRQPRALVI